MGPLNVDLQIDEWVEIPRIVSEERHRSCDGTSEMSTFLSDLQSSEADILRIE